MSDEVEEVEPVEDVDEVEDELDDDELEDDEDFEDEDEDDFNQVKGAVSRDVLDYLARSIVDEPDGVEVDVSERRNGVMLSLHVAPGDMGKVIGRRGRTAQAIRTIVRAAGATEGLDASVDIVD